MSTGLVPQFISISFYEKWVIRKVGDCFCTIFICLLFTAKFLCMFFV
jgi:hypothetical protein